MSASGPQEVLEQHHGREGRCSGSFCGGCVEEENREGKERKGDGQINELG